MIYVLLAGFAAFMWGSWMQVTKHLNDYPLPAFVYLLYFFSFLVVSIVSFIYHGVVLDSSILNEISTNVELSILLLICGALFSNGMLIQLNYMSKIGMVLVTSISSAFTTIFGVLVTVMVGGLPENVSVGLIIFSMFFMLLAGYICQYAGVKRDTELGIKSEVSSGSIKYIFYILIGNIMQTAYVFGYSVGTKTVVREYGFSPFVVVTILALGSFIGVHFSIPFILKKLNFKFKDIFLNARVVFYGLISGTAHYGGNLLNVIATASISAPIAFLIGKTVDFWTYLWGLLYGEFRGSSKKTMKILYSGFIVYIVGILLLMYSIYLF